MRNGLVIADSGPIFSLALIDKLDILDKLFDDVKISQAVWTEITFDKYAPYNQRIKTFFKDKTQSINSLNELSFIMDKGESESIILYKELDASFLLIDDKKARSIAETLNINCIGTLGLLSVAKDKGLISHLKPLFEIFLANKRYYSLELLNAILIRQQEEKIPDLRS